MKPAFDVTVRGTLHLDIVVHARALPRIDETAVGSSWKQVCGGNGGNQALQAAEAVGLRKAIPSSHYRSDQNHDRGAPGS